MPFFTRTLPAIFLGGICRKSRSLCMTFDDGPGRILTREVLALLDSYNAPATFFALGSRACAAPDVLDEIAGRGHEIGSHTDNHTNAWLTRPSDAAADIRDGYAALARWAPANGIFRPPFGKMSPGTMSEIRRRGAPVGWWTIDGGDVRNSLSSPGAAADALTRIGGGVVLLHDFDRVTDRVRRTRHVLQSTELALRAARREGLHIRRLSDVLFAPPH